MEVRNPYHHLHEKIAIVEMGSSTVEISVVKEVKAKKEDILVP